MTSELTIRVNTCYKLLIRASGLNENITMLYRYTKGNCYFTVLRVTSIGRWNVNNVLFNPNSVLVNSNSTWCDTNVTFHQSLLAIWTGQFPPLASNVEKIIASPNKSDLLFIRETGYVSRTGNVLGSCSLCKIRTNRPFRVQRQFVMPGQFEPARWLPGQVS